MQPDDIKYTNHAFDRMTERDISRATIEAVVRCGRLEREEIGDVRRYRLENMVVVMDGNVVVTVYFDSDERKPGQWNPKKKQRRGRAWLGVAGLGWAGHGLARQGFFTKKRRVNE